MAVVRDLGFRVRIWGEILEGSLRRESGGLGRESLGLGSGGGVGRRNLEEDAMSNLAMAFSLF